MYEPRDHLRGATPVCREFHRDTMSNHAAQLARSDIAAVDMPQASKRLSKVMSHKVKGQDSTSLTTQCGSQPSNANSSILFSNPPFDVVATEKAAGEQYTTNECTKQQTR